MEKGKCLCNPIVGEKPVLHTIQRCSNCHISNVQRKLRNKVDVADPQWLGGWGSVKAKEATLAQALSGGR